MYIETVKNHSESSGSYFFSIFNLLVGHDNNNYYVPQDARLISNTYLCCEVFVSMHRGPTVRLPIQGVFEMNEETSNYEFCSGVSK